MQLKTDFVGESHMVKHCFVDLVRIRIPKMQLKQILWERSHSVLLLFLSVCL